MTCDICGQSFRNNQALVHHYGYEEWPRILKNFLESPGPETFRLSFGLYECHLCKKDRGPFTKVDFKRHLDKSHRAKVAKFYIGIL